MLHTTRTRRTRPCAHTRAQRTHANPLRTSARALTHLPVVEDADRTHLDRRTVAKVGIDVPAPRASTRECVRVCARAVGAPFVPAWTAGAQRLTAAHVEKTGSCMIETSMLLACGVELRARDALRCDCESSTSVCMVVDVWFRCDGPCGQ